MTPADRTRCLSYLAKTKIPKLNIGAGRRPLSGWLNTDIAPRRSTIVRLDASIRFPFDDCTFIYIYSEHCIEHLTANGGLTMLTECARVLRPGGRVRIATPDLTFLTSLHRFPHTPRHQRYIRWAIDRFQPKRSIKTAATIINHFFRAWGHQFIYDQETLAAVMIRSGFPNPELYKVGRSRIPALRGIERHGRGISDEWNRMETFVMEARKQ